MFKLGRKRPAIHGLKQREPLGRILARFSRSGALPAYPSRYDVSGPSPKVAQQMYENDTLGCCVIAAMLKIVGFLRGAAGRPFQLFSSAQVTTLYSAIGGYVPGDPSTDQGCDEQTALNYWEAHGAPIGSTKLAKWVPIDPTNPDEVRLAIYLFENLFFGCELPDAWCTNFVPNMVWGPGTPNPANGHAFPGYKYTPDGVEIATWAASAFMPNATFAHNLSSAVGGELYVVLSPDQLIAAQQKAPNGLDWAALNQYMEAL